MINSFRTHPWRWATGILAGLGVVAWIAIGFFGVHTLFVDDVVAEAAPTFNTPGPVAEAPAEPAAEPSEPATSAPAPAPTSKPSDPSPESPETSETPETTGVEAAGTVPPTTTPTPPTTVATPDIVAEFAGTFVGESHPTVGDAIVLGNGTGQRFLRFENFETDNGPDLNVYLVNSSTGDVSDYIDLGDLKGNIGDQNYEIPEGVDLSVYDTVAIWCVRFSVGFGSAELAPA